MNFIDNRYTRLDFANRVSHYNIYKDLKKEAKFFGESENTRNLRFTQNLLFTKFMVHFTNFVIYLLIRIFNCRLKRAN